MGEESLQGRALTPPFLLSDRISLLLEAFLSPTGKPQGLFLISHSSDPV